MLFLLVAIEVILLFFLSNILKKSLFVRFYLLSRNQTAAVTFISLLLYPGVVVHELSHLITAVIFFVPVKSMTLVPKVVEGKIQGGSVVIQRVDVFRRTIVGIAPLFGGLTILWLLVRYLLPIDWHVVTSQISMYDLSFMNEWMSFTFVTPIIQTLVVCYLLFSISSTMYSSEKDLESLLYTVPIVIVAIVLLYIVGFQVSWVVALLAKFESLFANLSVVLGLVLGIQFVVYIVLVCYSTFRKPIRSG